jgi:hypothetical protein
MNMSCRRSLAAAALTAGLAVCSTAAPAAAQPPPGLPNVEPPPGFGVPPPPPPTPTPPEAQPPVPPPPAATLPAAPRARPPKGPVALASRVISLSGRRILLPLRCRRDGRVTLRTVGGRRLGAARYRCENFTGAAKFALSRRNVRRLGQRRRWRLVAVMRAGERTVRRSVTLTVPRRRSARAALHDFWVTGNAVCGSPFSFIPGYQVDIPRFASWTPGVNDWLSFRVWFYVWNRGWELGTDWSEWYVAPGVGETYIYPPVNFPVPAGYDWWVAAAVEFYWWNVQYVDANWLRTVSVDFGWPVIDNVWCHWV